MKTYHNLLIYLFILLIQTPLLSQESIICDFIQTIQNYQKSVDVVQNQKYVFTFDSIDMNTFNLQYYIKFFDKLNLKDKSKTIGIYYYNNFYNGKPYIYAIDSNIDILTKINYKANKINLEGQEREDFIHMSLYHYLNDSSNRACYNFMPEDNDLGYIQYLFFREFGEMFVHVQRSVYYKKRVICSTTELNAIYKQCIDITTNADTVYERYIEIYEMNELENIKRDTFMPINIIINENNCLITWYENTYSGLFKNTYQIQRKEPYKISLISEKKIASISDNYIY